MKAAIEDPCLVGSCTRSARSSVPRATLDQVALWIKEKNEETGELQPHFEAPRKQAYFQRRGAYFLASQKSLSMLEATSLWLCMRVLTQFSWNLPLRSARSPRGNAASQVGEHLLEDVGGVQMPSVCKGDAGRSRCCTCLTVVATQQGTRAPPSGLERGALTFRALVRRHVTTSASSL